MNFNWPISKYVLTQPSWIYGTRLLSRKVQTHVFLPPPPPPYLVKNNKKTPSNLPGNWQDNLRPMQLMISCIKNDRNLSRVSYNDGVALAQIFRESPLSLLNGTVPASRILHLVRKSRVNKKQFTKNKRILRLSPVKASWTAHPSQILSSDPVQLEAFCDLLNLQNWAVSNVRGANADSAAQKLSDLISRASEIFE